MKHLLEPTPQMLGEWLKDRGHPAYRAKQVHKWIFERRAITFEDMTDLPKKLREELSNEFRLWTAQVVKRSQAADGTEREPELLTRFPKELAILT